MKKLFYVMVFIAALVMSVSCTKDGFSSKDIIGTWEAVEGYDKWTSDGEVREERYSYEPGELVWVFNEDGTFQDLSLDGSDFDFLNYKVSGSKLIFSEGGLSVSIDIKKLDSKEMICSQSEREDGDTYYTEVVLKKRD